MATALEEITLALQMTGMLGIGASPSSAMASEGLRRYNLVLRELYATGGFYDKRINESFEIPVEVSNLRLLCMSGARSVTLPKMDNDRVRDGLRIHVVDASGTAATTNLVVSRNDWRVDGAATDVTISANGGEALLMLDAAGGTWRKFAAQALTDTFPLPMEFEEDFALILARRWSAARRFGQSLTDDEMRRADDGWRKLRARYVKPPKMAYEAAIANMGDDSAYGGSLSDFLNGIV